MNGRLLELPSEKFRREGREIGLKEGKKEGKKEGITQSISNLMKNAHKSFEEACFLLGINEAEMCDFKNMV